MGIPITEPQGNGSAIVSQVVLELVRSGHRIKSYCDSYAVQLAAGPTSADDILAMLQKAAFQVTHLQGLAATPELDAVARQIIPGYVGSLSGDANATVAAIQALVSGIASAVPKDGNGYALVHKWNNDGTVTARTFTPQQTAPLVTGLQAIGNTIG